MYKVKLSPYHKIFYNEWKLDPKSSKYNIVFDQTISSTLDVERLKAALGKFIPEHLIFNSHILEKDDEAYWVENSYIKQLDVFNDGYTINQIFEYVSSPFNLTSEPLYKFAIFKEADDSYRFITVAHHLVIDGNGFNSFIYTMSNYYNSKRYASKVSLEEQVKLLITNTKNLEKQLKPNTKNYSDFWESRLAEVEAVDLRFLKPCMVSKPVGDNNPIKELRFRFNRVDIPQLTDILAKYTITEYNYSQCIFAILLYKYTSQDKFAISYPVAIEGGTEFVYGSKINTNIIPFIFSKDITVSKLFKAIKDLIKQLKSGKFDYSKLPIDQIIGSTHTDILDVMFAKTNLKDTLFNFKKAKTLSINKDFNIDLYCKLCFEYESNEQELGFRVRYNSLETDEAILQNFVRHYQKLFIDVLRNLASGEENTLISKYQVLFPEEYQQIVYDWNKTEKDYPHDKTIHQLFEEQVARTPDNIAVVFEDKKLTYRELNQKANQLAHYLREKYQIKGDDLIALCLERNEYQLISILAVLKAGGAYVPLNIDYPDKHIIHILEDISNKVIITNASYHNRFINYYKNTDGKNILVIDSEGLKNKLVKYSITNPVKVNLSNDLAYIMYTSGTTGVPNGVMVEHKNVVSLVYKVSYIDIITTDCIAQLSDTSFDASVFEIWGALLHGASLYFPRNVIQLLSDLTTFKQLFFKYNISILWLTKTLFDELYIQDNGLFKNLKYLLIGGEALNFNLINKIVNSKDCPKCLINGYGPTENTTFSCVFRITKHSLLNPSTVPIGKPIVNRLGYILDNNLSPVPLGGIGELYVGGAGVARGYLKKLQLTHKRFLDNPFYVKLKNPAFLNKIYKTGDFVRLLPDGNIEYIGRNDSQIKVRGYRIELSEIESKLLKYPQIQKAIALVNLENKCIVAYYIAKHKLDESAIMNFLNAELPEYMRPQILSYLKKVPINKNGKLDVQFLSNNSVFPRDNHITPRNQIEAQICKIFAETLSLRPESISANHDFFALGGNSISVIRLVTKLQRNFNISVNDIFKLRTPAKISHQAQYTKGNLFNKLEQIKRLYTKAHNIQDNSSVHLEVDISFSKNLKKISTILLTGATGYLGCHILYKLLKETKYNIYLLVRGSNNTNKSVYNRVYDKFKYYFDINIDSYNDRLVIWKADLAKNNLNLNELKYQELVCNIDSIIHCAALVKHYGDYTQFYQANVQSTINILELCKLTKYKDFHYISTIGIFTDSSEYSKKYLSNEKSLDLANCDIFTEEHSITDKKNFYTYYTQTKYEGEQQALNYRQYGIKSSIYRVGNLSMNSKNYKNQKNIEDNAFFQRVKTILNFGVVPKELSEVEISPVDCVAEAIINLFQQSTLVNQTYHVFNPKICNLYRLFAKCKNVNVILTPFNNFIDIIQKHLDNNTDTRQLELFMLHQGWLNEEIRINNLARMPVGQYKTNAILTRLDFFWPDITSEMLSDIIDQSFKRINKMMDREQILKHLDFISQMAPAAFYLMDINGKFISVNEGTLKATGAVKKENIINKTVYELYKNKEVADALQKDIDEVIKTGKTSIKEDKIIDVSTGGYKYFTAIRAPLRDYDSEIFGVIGTSVEITAEKEAEQLKHENKKLEAQNTMNQIMLEKEIAEAERLRLENEVQKLENEKQRAVLEEQDRFRKFVGQVVHDIRSPLASLRGLVDASGNIIPEQERITLRQASMRITDIAQNMLREYKNEAAENEIAEPVLVPAAILEVLSEKRYEYNSVNFNHDFLPNTDFAFIQIEPSQFKRMISNLLNNAVEAIEGKSAGRINLILNVDAEWVNITITDNGKGMPKELIEKIENDIAVSEGKENGSGIGFTQIRDTIKRNFGKFKIFSTVDVRTSILIKFPKIPAPYWIAQEIKI
ncbi:MAG: putative Phenylalanine racemase (ATP-hydrolyzing), partial [Burkholderiales bacterium]|nr:putative Phenylalanine racemase (ATP-hydrolyzing) [Burkholderiales bacterium]